LYTINSKFNYTCNLIFDMPKKVQPSATVTKPNSKKHPFADPADHAGYLMWQVGMAWQRKLKNNLDPLGITHAQFLLLAALDYLSTQKNIVSQQDLANHIHIDKMMTSKILRTLQKKGLLSRRKSKIDTRARTLTLSESGTVLLEKAFTLTQRVDDDFLSALGFNSMTFTDDLRSLFKTT